MCWRQEERTHWPLVQTKSMILYGYYHIETSTYRLSDLFLQVLAFSGYCVRLLIQFGTLGLVFLYLSVSSNGCLWTECEKWFNGLWWGALTNHIMDVLDSIKCDERDNVFARILDGHWMRNLVCCLEVLEFFFPAASLENADQSYDQGDTQG